jgi:type IV pilus assembly protein PilC
VGEKIAASLQISGEFPSMVIRMVGVGEQSGALTETLAKVTQFYDKEITATIKRIFVLFEPMMIVLMGVVVGGIALSIFLPMFQMVQLIGG